MVRLLHGIFLNHMQDMIRESIQCFTLNKGIKIYIFSDKRVINVFQIIGYVNAWSRCSFCYCGNFE